MRVATRTRCAAEALPRRLPVVRGAAALLAVAIALSPRISLAVPQPGAGTPRIATSAAGQIVSADPAKTSAKPSAPPIHAVEQAIESRADTLVLPTATPGNLVVTLCTAAGCAPVSLLATERSRYFIGNSQVPLEDFRREVANRPSAGVVVLYDGKSRDLTRILMSAPPKVRAR